MKASEIKAGKVYRKDEIKSRIVLSDTGDSVLYMEVFDCNGQFIVGHCLKTSFGSWAKICIGDKLPVNPTIRVGSE